jgi:hypothetical protein
MREFLSASIILFGMLPALCRGLSVERGETGIRIQGDHFAISIDPRKGGEVTDLRLYDGTQWNTVSSPHQTTLPCVTLVEGDREFTLARDGKAEVIRVVQTPEKTTVALRAVPRAADGTASPWRIDLVYEVHPQGAVFIDLSYHLVGGTFALSRSTLALNTSDTVRKAPHYQDQNACKQIPGFRSARLAFGMNPACSFTNEIEVVVEHRTSMAGATDFKQKDGRFTWTLGAGGSQLKAPYAYQNRVALGLGAARIGKPKTNAIGQRAFHWVNWLDTDTWYPTNRQIDRMAELNATMLILHHEWMKQRGSNGYPHADYAVVRNHEEMTRTIAHAHEKGLRVGLYMRGVEMYGLKTDFFQEYCRRDWDGIYTDWHGHAAISWHEGRYKPEQTLHDAHLSPNGTYVPAREYFLFTLKQRETVGSGGFLIGHQGSFNCGILSNLAYDAYLPGETGSDHAMFADRDKAIYKGMVAGVPCMPWTLDSPTFRSPEGAAKMAAWGFYPHIVLGLRPPRSKELFPLDPDDAKYTALYPYWRVLAAAKAENLLVENSPARNAVLVTSSDTKIQGLVYRAQKDAYLVIVANLSPASSKARLRLNAEALGLMGQYKVAVIDSATGKGRNAGETHGELTTSDLPAWGIEGFLLTKQ